MKNVYTAFEEQIHIDTIKHYANWRMPYMHYHSVYELLLINKGGFSQLVDDRILTGYQYDVFTIPPYMMHKNNGGMDHERTAVNFPIEYLKKYYTQAAIEELLSCYDKEMHTISREDFNYIFSELMELKKHPEEFYRLANVLMVIKRSDRYQTTVLPKSKSGGISEYINRHYNEITGLSQLAEKFCVSKEHLCRVFKSDTGMTVSEYTSKVRIKHACDMLRTTDKKVTDIAFAVGYESLGYFNRVFKKEMGLSPSDFRKEQFQETQND